MTSKIPLYPLRTRLKDIVVKYAPKVLILETPYGTPAIPENCLAPNSAFGGDYEQLLYDNTVNHYYYSEIGFDTTEQFVQRFSQVWYKNIGVAKRAIEKALNYENNTENLTISGRNTSNKTISTTGTNSKDETITKTGDIEYQKGVSTQSSQTTDNSGQKLTRSTPNEDMSVKGEASTTVVDSGSDTDIYNTTDKHIGTNTTQDNTTENGSLNVDTTNTRTNLSLSDILAIPQVQEIIDGFIDKFHNIFMEVFD